MRRLYLMVPAAARRHRRCGGRSPSGRHRSLDRLGRPCGAAKSGKAPASRGFPPPSAGRARRVRSPVDRAFRGARYTDARAGTHVSRRVPEACSAAKPLTAGGRRPRRKFWSPSPPSPLLMSSSRHPFSEPRKSRVTALFGPALEFLRVAETHPAVHFVAGLPARVLLALLWVYQRALSPVLPVVFGTACGCRFSPTCSHYAADAVRTHGAIVGSFLAARRLLKCSPLHPGGFDPVPPVRSPRAFSCTSVPKPRRLAT